MSPAPLGTPRLLPAAAALVRIPSSRAEVVGVVQTDYLNAVTQSISYRTEGTTRGENSVDISVFNRNPGFFRIGARLERAALPSLEAEARRAFPGATTLSAPRVGQNGFGPFGYVIAPGNGRDRCILAIQNHVGAMRSIDARIRYCGPGMSDRSLVELVQGISHQTYYSTGYR